MPKCPGQQPVILTPESSVWSLALPVLQEKQEKAVVRKLTMYNATNTNGVYTYTYVYIYLYIPNGPIQLASLGAINI